MNREDRRRQALAASPFGNAAQAARKVERVVEFKTLTRDHGMSLPAACRRMGISRASGWNYEAEIAKQTGETIHQAHRRLFSAFLESGLTPKAAAQVMGRHPDTGRNWYEAMQEAS